MIVREAKGNGKIFEIDWDFNTKYLRLVKEVLNCLKGKSVSVPDASEKWRPPWTCPKSLKNTKQFYNRLRFWRIPKGYQHQNLSLAELGMIEIPILKYLPLVCEHAAFFGSGKYYSPITNPIDYAFHMRDNLNNNVRKHIVLKNQEKKYIKSINLLNYYHWDRVAGYIRLAPELGRSKDAFRFVLAHEIQHAIDQLEIAYPALTNWEGFCYNILELKTSTRDDLDGDRWKTSLLDGYNGKYQLGILEDTFGHSVLKWYKGYVKFGY